MMQNHDEESPVPEFDANQKEDWENEIISEDK